MGDFDSSIGMEEQEIIVCRPWGDAPEDILVLIHNKLRFVDQVRFRAVCKNWKIPKYDIKSLDSLPWVIKFSWINIEEEPNKYPFVCELFDPYSQKVYKVSNSIQHFENQNSPSDQTTLFASKYGWSLLGLQGDGSLLFLHNPFANEVIMLPHLDFICKAATFTMNPTSPECEILVLCRPEYTVCFHNLYVARYCPNKDKEWCVTFLEVITKEPLSVCYMNGELYCLFCEGILKSYNLIEELWKLAARRLPYASRYFWRGKCWLIENGCDLMLACGQSDDTIRLWSLFKMDWSKMSWMLELDLDNVALLISGNISLMAPLEDDSKDMIDDYRAFYSDEEVGIMAYEDHYGWMLKCYFLQKRKQVQLEENSCWTRTSCYRMGFIQPPYVRN